MFTKHLLMALFIANASAAFSQQAAIDPSEKKVDYLEKVYFSGLNKGDLTDVINQQVQQMGSQFDSNMLPSPAYLKQYVFLKNLMPQLEHAENACDIVDMLAVGIRDLDITEAMAQGIKQPSEKARQNSADALAGISKVNNSISTTNSALNTLAWTNYLSSGKAVGFGTLSKVGGVTNTLGAGVAAAQAGTQIFGAAKSLGMFRGHDKACKDVPKKDIALGEHKFTPAIAPTVADAKQYAKENAASQSSLNAGTTVGINKITFKQLSTLRPLIEKMNGVTDVSTEKFENNVATLKISNNLELDELLDNITHLTTAVSLEVSASDSKNNSGTLICKP